MSFTKITNAGFGLTTGTLVGVAASFSSTVSVGGTLTYEDVTNVDSVGLITARNGIEVTDKGVQVGTGATVDSAAANTLTFLTGGSEALRVDSSQRLLVGTNANRSSSALQVEGTSFATSRLSLTQNSATANAGATLKLSKSRGTSNNSNTVVVSGDRLGNVQFSGADGSGDITAASIEAFVDGSPGTNDMPGRLVFSTTADGASSSTERMRISNDGTVRIGDGSVNAAGVGAGPALSITGAAPEITLRDSATGTPYAWMATNDAGSLVLSADQGNNAGSSIIDFRVDGTERLRITSSGMFGFNHSSPQFGITIAQSANDIGRIGWEDGSNNKRASITCSSSTDALQFHVGTSDTERLRIGSSGQIGLAGANYGTSGQVIKSNGSSNAPTWQNQNAFVFYGEQNSAQNITTTTYTRLTNFNSRKVEEGDSSVAVFDESSGKLTIGANGAGLYYLEMGGGIDDIQNSDYVQIVIGKNGGSNSIGTRISSYGKAYNGTTANAIVNANTSCIVNLSANDVIRFYIFHNEGSTEPTEPNRCYCLGYKMN